MDDAIGDVVLAPFRDIVAQGTVAAGNAGDSGNDEMLKAAQNLVQAGERALRRIEPLCLKNYDEFGSNFVNALKDNEEISQFTESLTNLLYDFEDYVEAQSFDAGKFLELQTLLRKGAPRMLHIIPRMKLEAPQADQDLESGEGPEVKHLEASRILNVHTVQEEEPPPPLPILDPWAHTFQTSREGLDLTAQRRDTIASSDSAVGSEANSVHNLSPVSGLLLPAVPPRSPARPTCSHNTVATLRLSTEQTASLAGTRGRESILGVSSRLDPRSSAASSADISSRGSVSDPQRERGSYFDVVSPVAPQDRVSTPFEGHEQIPYVKPLFSRQGVGSATPSVEDGLEPVIVPTSDIPDGLIPVEEEPAEPVFPSERSMSQLGDCGITLSSSFYQFKGFCQGAMEIIQGGVGVRRVRKQGLSGGAVEVAKCKACQYELQWSAVERDMDKKDSENFKSAGIGFRIRFLTKSHIQAKHVGDQIYACLFCVQLGNTTHPNDATVFFSQKQLFAHLARHPRPLPQVPGLTVIEAEEVGHRINNYDLHLPRAPLEPHLATIMRDIVSLPTATAVQTYRSTPTRAMRKPTDEQDVVTFAKGARILGVHFPERYNGEWCLGWSDHEYGAFPADAIRLDPPRKGDMRLQSSSTMKAVARWKFSPRDRDKGNGGWLQLGKGEVVTNIGWPHQDHWCWTGTNNKGKRGIFPRSHIEPGTLVDTPKPDRASIGSSERKKSGLFSRISILH